MQEKSQGNKKIKNATSSECGSIKFRSTLEKTVYTTLVEAGYNPVYEEKHCAIFKEFIPTIPFYTKNTFKRKNKGIHPVTNSTVMDLRKVPAWVYTPDFYFEYNDYIIFIEVKGFGNDVFRYKTKLFRGLLEEMQKEDPEHRYEYWMIYSKKQLLDCLQHIR